MSAAPSLPSSSFSKNELDEAMIDKFATLFSPPTPRASPTEERGDRSSIWSTSASTKRLSQTHQHVPPLSPDSEFGAFVSVPTSEDPLAAADFSFSSPTTTRATQDQGHARNPSLSFFEEFGKEAKNASERSKKGILDELLNESPWPSSGTPKHQEPDPDPDQWGPPELQQSLIDLEHNFFSHTPPRPAVSRSPTLSRLSPPAVAAASTSKSAADVPAVYPTSSTSYKTLSDISSKWMSGLLSSSSSTPSTQAPTFSRSRPSLDSVFDSSTKIQGVHHPSPFAPHIVAPGSITGAPGFTGERYDWDKGFSTELSQELEKVGGVVASASTPVTMSSSTSSTPGAPPSSTLGGLIEKKSGHVDLKGRREYTEKVLDATLADKIRTHLPALSRLPRTWNLLYSLDQHGISLNTLYTKTEAAAQVKVGSSGFVTRVGVIVVVKDSGDGIFGVFVGDGLHKDKGYYGSGESFLWRQNKAEPDDVLEVFKWTGKNGYVALCEGNFLSFGGGDGTYGLYIESSLLQGSSAPCPTFGNPPLCSDDDPGARKGRTVTFDCVGLEVWSVGP